MSDDDYVLNRFMTVSYSLQYLVFQVHVRHKNCTGAAVACVCAIAVREGNDTLILDMCQSDLQILYRTASSNNQLAEGAKISSDGANAYTVR